MRSRTLFRALGFGALTGVRSMAGPAALAFERDGPVKNVVGLLAAGEMIVDKTPFVGDRIDAAPLAARAVMGGIVGGVVAYEADDDVLIGGLIGASAAIAAAHLAYRLRKRLPFSNPVGGAIEDAFVVGLGAMLKE
jgi:uncharacterized membrane protein